MIFEDFRAFVSVAQHGSFTQAAADLCIAQSALSKRVLRLEQRMGTALLVRHARGVSLTQAGHALMVRAQRVVDEVADIERNLSSFALTPSGQVRIALPQRTCGLLAPPVVARVRAELPLVDLHVLEGTPSNVHGWLMRGETDIAMTYNAELGSGFQVRPFLVEPLLLFSSTEMAAHHFGGTMPERCAISDLAMLPLILPRKPHVVRLLVDRLCNGHGLRPNVIFEADGPTTIRGMVEQGLGVTLFSLSTSWSYAVESGQLVALPFASPLVNWKMYLACTRRDLGTLATTRVLQIVEQELDRLLERGAWPNARRIEVDSSLTPALL